MNKDGAELFQHGNDQDMSPDAIFWLAPGTKLLTLIAAMQLVELDVRRLDDSDPLEMICPDLKQVLVLETSDGSLRLLPEEERITLRMLLNHTGISFTPAIEAAY
jgi:CubicO group peptidase (beta-lactamase class C family)